MSTINVIVFNKAKSMKYNHCGQMVESQEQLAGQLKGQHARQGAGSCSLGRALSFTALTPADILRDIEIHFLLSSFGGEREDPKIWI